MGDPYTARPDPTHPPRWVVVGPDGREVDALAWETNRTEAERFAAQLNAAHVAGRGAGLEEAAMLIENNMVRFNGDGQSLAPRRFPDTSSALYATAIRALIDVPLVSKESSPDRVWGVDVRLNGKDVVTIETNHLAGPDIGPDEEWAIRSAAENLLAFIGASPSTAPTAERWLSRLEAVVTHDDLAAFYRDLWPHADAFVHALAIRHGLAVRTERSDVAPTERGMKILQSSTGENVMPEFAKYRRSQIAELRPYVAGEKLDSRVSISATDRGAGSPKLGDMIARNPKNHDDMWLVAARYFADNFEAAE